MNSTLLIAISLITGLFLGASILLIKYQKLKKQFFKYQDIFNGSGDLIFVVNQKGTILKTNSIVTELLGMDANELEGMRINLLVDFNKEKLEDELSQKFDQESFVQNLVDYGKIVNLDTHLLNRVHHRLPVLLSGRQVFDAHGERDGFILSARDMRLQKERQLQVIQNSKMTAINLLTAGVAHEINNPLMILKGNLDILMMTLKEEIQANIKIHRLFEKQKMAILRVTKIVSGLRDYSRTQKNIQHVIELNQVVENILDLLKSTYKEKGIVIESQLIEENIKINGEASKVNQIMSCLIANAVEAVAHVDNPRIVIESQTFEDMAILRVSDNGNGIPQTDLVKIFDMFYTTKASLGATGMGLGIVNRLVTELDGHVYVKSKMGKGSSFYLEFPLAAKGLVKDTSSGEVSFEKLSGRALVVDDEPHILEIISKYLTDMGIEVETSSSPVKALELLRENSFDYILTDYLMPTLRGDEFLQKVQFENLAPHSNFYIITGVLELKKIMGERKDELYDSVEQVILKPFSKMDLYKALRLSEATVEVKKAS